jgi:16S rRNA (cytosine1402-N4)-methyltransferase
MLQEVLTALDPQPGMIVVDCTVGFAGHSAELLKRVGPSGKLIGLDLDAQHLSPAQARLETIGFPFYLEHANFAGLPTVLAAQGLNRVDALLADLGMSSMQVDDPARGFSYVRDGALDMRMDRSRGRSAAQLLVAISRDDLIHALHTFGDEPQADRIADAILHAREQAPIVTTRELSLIIQDAAGAAPRQLQPGKGKWTLHPAARTFQALRILVNREINNLEQLLRILPGALASNGRAAIISFHSGEDRLVKSAFRAGLADGTYQAISPDPLRAPFPERMENPRSRSAKLRWCQRAPI